jgi:hypothetical protein
VLAARSDARCFFDVSILKTPKPAPATRWHQDEAFRDPNFEYKEITVWVALQQVQGGNRLSADQSQVAYRSCL